AGDCSGLPTLRISLRTRSCVPSSTSSGSTRSGPSCLGSSRSRAAFVSICCGGGRGGAGGATLPLGGPRAPGPEGEASLREQLSRLERALDDLDEGPREAIVLFHIEEMSYRDIAAALEVPMGTVMTWLHRGRVQLKKAVDGDPTTPQEHHPKRTATPARSPRAAV